MPTKGTSSTTLNDLQSLLPDRSLIDELFNTPPLRDLPFRGLLETGFKILLLLALFLMLHWILRALIRRTGERLALQREAHTYTMQAARVRTLTTLSESFLFYTLIFFFAVSALGLLGVNVLGLVGTAGVAGLAVGFGAQKLVKDVISGFFLLLEDQYGVGEYVTIGGVSGAVEELGMRSTRLRDDDGKLYILSNGDITQVCNHSRGPVASSFEIGIAATADIKAATEAINKGLAPQVESLSLYEAPYVAGVSATDAAKTTLKVVFHATILGSAKRPSVLALTLREVARDALVAAGITLA